MLGLNSTWKEGFALCKLIWEICFHHIRLYDSCSLLLVNRILVDFKAIPSNHWPTIIMSNPLKLACSNNFFVWYLALVLSDGWFKDLGTGSIDLLLRRTYVHLLWRCNCIVLHNLKGHALHGVDTLSYCDWVLALLDLRYLNEWLLIVLLRRYGTRNFTLMVWPIAL